MGLTDPEDNSPEGHARRVREMFAQIAPRYDLLNHLLSANIDGRWRRAVIRKLGPSLPANAQLLDIACGTGDLSISLFEKLGAQVVGLDSCRPMLEIAARKTPRLRFVEGDALQLPFADSTFDAVTIGFGLRNLANAEQGLSEMRRVLKPQGWAAILEFSKPVVPGMRAFASIYCARLLPRIGGWISGSPSAYQYLPDSISHFPDQQRLAAMMRHAAFDNVAFQNLTGGIAALHTGQRSE